MIVATSLLLYHSIVLVYSSLQSLESVLLHCTKAGLAQGLHEQTHTSASYYTVVYFIYALVQYFYAK